MNVMIPVRPDGSVEPRFGKAPMVAVAQVDNDGHVTDWHTFKVEWDRLHNEGTEGRHHARIVRFLREHDVVACVATRWDGNAAHPGSDEGPVTAGHVASC